MSFLFMLKLSCSNPREPSAVYDCQSGGLPAWYPKSRLAESPSHRNTRIVHHKFDVLAPQDSALQDGYSALRFQGQHLTGLLRCLEGIPHLL